LENESIASALDEMNERQREWARCRHWIVEAIAAAGQEPDTIAKMEQGVGDCRMVFWAASDYAAIARIDQFGQNRILTVTHAGGNLESLLHRGIGDFDRFASMTGCNYLGDVPQTHFVADLIKCGFKPALKIAELPTLMLRTVDEIEPASNMRIVEACDAWPSQTKTIERVAS
jgi:hypothetical protein